MSKDRYIEAEAQLVGEYLERNPAATEWEALQSVTPSEIASRAMDIQTARIDAAADRGE